jgi:hypothetical protein
LYRGRLRRNSTVIIFFRCPLLRQVKFSKPPPPQQAKQEHKALYLYLEKQAKQQAKQEHKNSLSLFRETKTLALYLEKQK